MADDILQDLGIPSPNIEDDILSSLGMPPPPQKQQPRQQKGPFAEYNNVYKESPMLAPIAQMLSNHPAAEMLVQALGKGLEPVAKNAKQYMGDPFYNAASELGIPGALGGAAESITNPYISAANLVEKGRSKITGTEERRLPHLDLTSRIKPTLANKVGYVPGMLYGALKGTAGNFYKNIADVARPDGKLGLISDALRGYATGYLFGENKHGGGRELSGGIGAIAAPISSILNAKAAERVVGKADKLKQESETMYNAVFNGAKNAGVDKLNKLPDIDYNTLQGFKGDKLAKSMTDSLKTFMRDRTLESAHNLQSDLGGIINKLSKQHGSLTTLERNTLSAAIDAQKRLRGSLFDTLNKAEPGLGKLYQNATKHYSDKVAPYIYNKNINQFIGGDQTAGDLMKSLGGSKLDRAQIVPNHPEIYLNLAARHLLPATAAFGAGGLGVYLGGKALSDKLMSAIYGGHGGNE